MSKCSIVELRLHAWASWFIGIQDGEIGWPEKSTLAIFMEQGFIPSTQGFKQSNPPYPYSRSEEMNTFINQMRLEKPKFAYAVIHFYLTNKRVQELAKEAEVKRNTFYEWLREGKKYLEKKLEEAATRNNL